MDKLFPQMYDRPEPRPIGVSLVYWFAFVVGLPSLMSIFLVQTVASQDYSGTSWIIMLFCVVNNNQVTKLADICRKYPHTFAIIDPVSEVMGNFKKIDTHGKPEVSILDSADGKAV